MVKAPHESHRPSRPFNVTRDSCYPAPHPSKKHILLMHMHMYLLGTRTLNRGEEIGRLASSARFSIVTAISWSFEHNQHEREDKISEAQISAARDILKTSSIQSMGGTKPTLPTSRDSASNHAVPPRERERESLEAGAHPTQVPFPLDIIIISLSCVRHEVCSLDSNSSFHFRTQDKNPPPR